MVSQFSGIKRSYIWEKTVTLEGTNDYLAGVSEKRARSRALRRRQLIAATIDSINRVGFAETTLASVARIAGVSQASVVFHFKTKDALLVATLRDLSEEYQAAWTAALAAAPAEPIGRICALAAADFEPDLVTRKKIAVWQAFWAEAKSRPTYMRICGEREAERSAVMTAACAQALRDLGRGGESAEDLAAAIDSLSDGLWQRLLADYRSFTRRDALRVVFSQLKANFPEHAAAIDAAAGAGRPGVTKGSKSG